MIVLCRMGFNPSYGYWQSRLYHWSHMELQTYFGVYDIINEQNAPAIWEKVNAKLAEGGYPTRQRPYHKLQSNGHLYDRRSRGFTWNTTSKLKTWKGFETQVLPSYRPDKALEINRATFLPWIGQLEAATGTAIRTYDDLLAGLKARAVFFDSVGCKVSDHALGLCTIFAVGTKRRSGLLSSLQGSAGQPVSLEDEKKYKAYTPCFS